MLNRLVNLVRGGGKETSSRGGFLISFGDIPVPIRHPDILQLIPIANTRFNLEWAREAGIEPLSFQEIINQLGGDKLPHMVLFDTPPHNIGNHWRVINAQPDHVTLQLCNEFGNQDYSEIPLIDVPTDKPFFTGVSLHTYSYNNRLYGLEPVTRWVQQSLQSSDTYPEGLRSVQDDIYWSSPTKTLTLGGSRPMNT